jgi:hypothetical protein
MISTAVDQADTDDRTGITDALNKLFASANGEQKRMMLKITGSHNERANWLQSLEINMVLALIRSKDKNGVWNIEYELMQLCTEEQQQQIINKMSTIDKQKYDLW